MGMTPAARQMTLYGLLALGVCALPFVLKNFQVFQITMALSYAVALFGLNMLTGYNGQISLGHGAFYAIGAYTTAVLIDRLGVPYGLTILIAAGVCFVAGFLFGLPALRLEGIYLALATFALAVAVPQLLKFKPLEHITGGVQGINISKPEAPFGLPLSPDRWLYFLTLLVVAVMFVLGANLLRSRHGRAMVAIRDQPIAAAAMGINNAMTKSVTFGISALYAGVSGSLGALLIQFVAPDSFNVFLSLSLLIGVVVGGLASIWGAIFGGFFIQFIPNVADQISESAPWAIYGIILILFMFFMPTGVVGLIAKLRARWLQKRPPAHGPQTH